jgi:hypothetical protein
VPALCGEPAFSLTLGAPLSLVLLQWLTNMTWNGTDAVCVGQILYQVGPTRLPSGRAGMFYIEAALATSLLSQEG